MTKMRVLESKTTKVFMCPNPRPNLISLQSWMLCSISFSYFSRSPSLIQIYLLYSLLYLVYSQTDCVYSPPGSDYSLQFYSQESCLYCSCIPTLSRLVKQKFRKKKKSFLAFTVILNKGFKITDLKA